MSNLYTQRISAEFIKIRNSFKGFFYENPVDNAQQAFEVLDDILRPLVDFDSQYGLYPLEDKELLQQLQGTVEDIQNLLSDFDMHINDIQDQQVLNFDNLTAEFRTNLETFKTDIEDSIQLTVNNALNEINVKVEQYTSTISSIETRLSVVEDCCANGNTDANHLLTSSFASFTYESIEPLTEHIIEHNLNSYTLLGDPLMMNEDGLWERDLANLTIIDENTVKVNLTEPRHMLLTMTAVEYFVSFVYEGSGTTFDIEHKLGSFNLVWSIYMKENDTWVNDLGKVFFVDINNIKVVLTEPQDVRICLMRLS